MITTENEFYIRFVLLLIEGGTDVLRVMLKHELEKKNVTFENFLSSVKDRIKSAVYITKKQLELLYPFSTKPPELCKCDISILAYLLNEFFTTKGSSESKAVNTIKKFRNDFFAHPKTASLEVKQFNSIWNKLSMAILSISHDFTKNERERFKETIERLSNDALDINSALETLRTLDQTDEFNENINIRLTQLDQAVQYCHQDIQLMKQQITELQKTCENQGLPTKVVNTVYGSIRLSALEQKTVEEAEKVLLAASKESLGHLESSQPHQTVRKAVDNFVQDMNDKGLKVDDVSEGSIVFTIKCQSFEDLIGLIDYFDSPMINNHLDAISNALSEVTGQKIEIHAMISTDRLSEELGKHERYSKTVKVTVRCSGLDSLRAALDVFERGDAARKSFSGLQDALSEEVGKPLDVQTAIDVESMQTAIDTARKELADFSIVQSENTLKLLQFGGNLESDIELQINNTVRIDTAIEQIRSLIDVLDALTKRKKLVLQTTLLKEKADGILRRISKGKMTADECAEKDLTIMLGCNKDIFGICKELGTFVKSDTFWNLGKHIIDEFIAGLEIGEYGQTQKIEMFLRYLKEEGIEVYKSGWLILDKKGSNVEKSEVFSMFKGSYISKEISLYEQHLNVKLSTSTKTFLTLFTFHKINEKSDALESAYSRFHRVEVNDESFMVLIKEMQGLTAPFKSFIPLSRLYLTGQID